MAGIMKNIMPVTRSISGKEFVDFDADISIALEYTGSPIDHSCIPRAFPVDVDRIPTAKVAASPALLSNLSLPVVEPIVRSHFKSAHHVRLGSRVMDSRLSDVNDHDHVDSGGGVVKDGNFKRLVGGKDDEVERSDSRDHSHELSESCRFSDGDGNGNGNGNGNGIGIGNVNGNGNGSGNGKEELKSFVGKKDDGVGSSGTLGFSDSRDHSHELSESSDMLETPVDCQEIEEGFPNWNCTTGPMCEEEEASDGEALECRRRRKPAVTFCDRDSDDVGEESAYGDEEGGMEERRVAQKPAKKGMCYHCHTGNRFTEKVACIVCDAKYCRRCVLKAMGSMPEGRKCLNCIGYNVHESKRHVLGKCPRMLKSLFSESEVKQVMEAELSCPYNQLPPQDIFVNGTPLCLEELMYLRSCPNPPRNLRPGKYWYDKVSGFWGKEGQKPCQIITPRLNVGDQIKRDASNGNTNILINNREITKAELWMLQSAGVQCAGNLSFWVEPDGTYIEEGMNLVKGKIWGRKRTKVLCALLSLPTPESPHPGGQMNHPDDGLLQGYLEQRTLCKVLLVGNDQSGTSTFYKQARVLYDRPFSEEELQNIKFMIQSNLYGYLGRLLEGREQFEEESLSELRDRQSTGEPGPSGTPSEIQVTEYTIGPRLKNFSDWLIKIMVSGNLDIMFPAATREYAPYVEELWKDAAIQATYSRKDELELPRAASYFLDKAVEIAKQDYEPSDTDILYAEGITSPNGLASMEFSFPQTSHDGYRDPAEQPDPVTRCELVRVHAKSLGENCKWVEMFEDVGIVLFCVSLTEYDEYELNSNGVLTNKMLESRRFFENIVTHPTFEDTNFLLVLNKFDLLEEKIEQVPLTNCEWFQDFNPVFSRHQSSRSGSNNQAPLAQRAFHYIAVKYKRLYSSLTGKKLYVCPVTALESDTVGSALKYAREIVRWEEDKLSFSLNESSCESIDIEQSSSS